MAWQSAPLRMYYRLTAKRARWVTRRRVLARRYLELAPQDPRAVRVLEVLHRLTVQDRQWALLQRAALRRAQEIDTCS